MNKSKRLSCLVLIFVIWFNFFAPLIPAQNEYSSNGLRFRLHERTIESKKRETPEPVVSLLSEPETNVILRRLPPIAVAQTDKTNFADRSKTIPPPRTGNVIPIKFPADEQIDAPNDAAQNAAPLRIARFAPDGKIALVSDLSITFSQPMIAVAAQEEAAENVPVELSPPVRGRWRWLGTTTLIFDAESRFPMATKYAARIPAGTKAAAGGALEKDFSWTFETPPPKLENFYPSARQTISERDPVMTAKFNQAIDEAAILPKMKVTANEKPIAIRLVTKEIKEEHNSVRWLGDVKPGHWLAFRAVEPLPLDAEIKVAFEKGLPSAEGALTSEAAQEFSFRTYGALRFVKSHCGYNYDPKKEECEPSEVFRLEFNNTLFPMQLDGALVKIEPPLADARISTSGNAIIIDGKKQARTTYRVTVAPALKDYYQQTLGEEIKAVFKVGTERPQFFAEGGNFVTLDPHTKRRFSVYSRNHAELRVRLYKVSPGDWDAFRQALSTKNYRDNDRNPIPGRLVFDRQIAPGGAPDEMIETRIDLTSALENDFGQVIIRVEPAAKPKQTDYYYERENEPLLKWLQATAIGLDAFVDNENLTALVTDLKTGKTLSDVQAYIFGGASGATDENGLAVLRLPQSSPRSGVLVAKIGADTAILPEYTDYYQSTNWYQKTSYGALRWNVFDDRGMYRPKEEVSVKGYVRRLTPGKFADIAEYEAAEREIFYKIKDSRQNEVLKGQTRLNRFGAFDFKFKLPDNFNLGYASIHLGFDANADEHAQSFQVQEFRRPEFEVSVSTETPAPFFVGDSAALETQAKYYAGGFLTNAPVNWTIYAAQTNYTPPNRDDFNFGTFHPWWSRDYSYAGGGYREYQPSSSQNFEGVTNADGKHGLKIDFVTATPARPYLLTAGARVQDVNRQAIANSASLLVHPADLYVGLRTPKSFVRGGDRFEVETIATDLEGKAIPAREVTIKAVLRDWQLIGGGWQNVELDTQTCRIKSTETVAACTLTAKQGGVFTITASVLDDRERLNESETTLWVKGAQTPSKRGVEKENVLLIPDQKEYAPGDVAEILVNAPFAPAEGVLTLRRNGVVETEHFTINESSTVLQIPIEEKYLPNIHAQVDLVGAAERTDDKGEIDKNLPPRPSFASGALNLKISTASRRLNVSAEPLEKTLEPGAATKVSVEVKDRSGAPVADAEVALVAVDEGVLALSNYSIRNPLDVFYADVNPGVNDFHSRGYVVLGNPGDRTITAKEIESLPINNRQFNSLSAVAETVDVTGSENGFSLDGKSGYQNWSKKDVAYIMNGKDQSIKIRQNFNALATFAPSVVTDANGKAMVEVKLPDNLTRYRITAVAVTKAKQFGKAESNLTAKKSLQIRPSAPRFMNYGDRAEFPVVVQNQSDKPLTVDVAVRASNARLPEGNGRRVTVPANDRVEIRFPALTERAGTARFQIGAVSGRLSDAAEISLPVWTPATTESFATYGTTEASGAIVQPIEAPRDVFSEFGGLEVTTSSTQLQELTDAFIYLQTYPFDCSEQVSSRILSVAALRDVLTAFNAKDLPSKEEIEAQMTRDIARLQQLQHDDGGYSFWSGNDESIPYVSVHVAHALARAALKGYKVPRAMIERAKNYLDEIESKLPENYSQEAKWAIRAYAFYVLNLLEDNEGDDARYLIEQATLEKLPPEAIGWLLAVLIDDKNDRDSLVQVEKIKRHLLNRVTETAGAAHFVTEYKDGEYVLLASRRRADAVILESLLKASETDAAAGGKYDDDDDETPAVDRLSVSDLTPKIVRGLLANRTKGRWRNTQENIFILLALDKYFQTFERVTPNFVARVWFGQTFAGEQKFAGRSTGSNSISVPMNYLQKQAGNLVLDKQGEGRIYYRIGLNYAPKNLKLAAADYGFIVNRRYEAIDQPDDVKQNPDGSWTIRAGARIRVQLQMIAPTRRYHVALVDKLPAGLEIVNSALATSEMVPQERFDNTSGNRDYYRGRGWFEHQNLRDERAEAFTSLLWEGSWSYSYVARATTPGTYVVPPAKAEEMYAPETFGRSKTDTVKVE